MIRLLLIGILFLSLFLLQREVYKRSWQKHLNVKLAFSANHIFEGECGELTEVVENRKRLPLSMLKVKFRTDRHLIFEEERGSNTTDLFYRNDMFRIGGGEKVTRSLRFRGGRRGYYTIDEAGLVSSDLFLSTMFAADTPASAYIYVYPRPYDSEMMRRSLTKLNGEVLARRHVLEDPFEYRGIREYRPSDPMRSINWKATAKTGELKVNQKNYTSLKSIRVFFNVESDGVVKRDDCLEASLSIVAGLCKYFLGQGIRVACYGNGVDVHTAQPVVIDARAGDGQMDNIYRALARLDLQKPAVNFSDTFEDRLFDRAAETVTCFVASNRSADYLALLERYSAEGYEYHWFYPVPGSREPELPSNLAKSVSVIHLGL